MAICHNGNLTNAPQLRHKLEMNGSIFHGTSDTEVIGYLLTQNRLISPDIETAVCRTMEQIVGAYSLVIMTHTKLIAARDPMASALSALASCRMAPAGLLLRNPVRWML